ncbi:MAG: hypothetical protein FLDDKLPJ_03576 [Phycisphaerae bacterium]|nr:hypothetical protein [Phycisphaerae bacterium]
MKRISWIHAAVAGASLMAGRAAGNDFQIAWSTIDGGGGSSAGGAFEVSGAIGQPDAGELTAAEFSLTGGFWGGAAGGGCTGGERVGKAKCRARNGGNQLKVVLRNGQPGDAFTVTLDDGATDSGTINARGKGKAVFNGRPSGGGSVQADWSCGATDEKSYDCP